MDLRNTAITITAVILAAACTGNNEKKAVESADDLGAISVDHRAAGDSALYGLACDGCTDSIIVLLPNEGGDPDTFDIINASLKHKVFGKPSIGDRLAVMVNPEDSGEAVSVVDLDKLRGCWCNRMMPKMRDITKMPKRLQRRIMADLPDSIKEKLLVPREVGYLFKREFTVRSIGLEKQASTTEEQSMVEYPSVRLYDEWRLFNNRLILSSKEPFKLTEEESEDRDSMQADRPAVREQQYADTVEFIMLTSDSLILGFKNGNKGFYRKK